MPTCDPKRADNRDRWHRDGDRIDLGRLRRSPQPVDLAARPDAVRLDLSRCAIVIIDMQNDFLHSEGWFATDRGANPQPLLDVVPRINELAAAARAAAMPVIHLNWGVRADGLNLPANVRDKASDCGARRGYGDAGPQGPVLVAGSWGAQSIAAITVETGDIQIEKHRLSGFPETVLEGVLLRQDITTLIYCGVNTDRCVFATLADGCFRGFDAVLVEDACATPSPPHVPDAILYLVRLLYGFTVQSADIVQALTSHTEKE